jgi:ATP-dependent Clp protease, protease subunit
MAKEVKKIEKEKEIKKVEPKKKAPAKKEKKKGKDGVLPLGGTPLLPPDPLSDDRVVIINTSISEATCGGYIRELTKFLHKDPDKMVTIYLDCPGGSVSVGLAIISLIKMIQAHGAVVRTVCLGVAASMGAHILAAGTKGYRYVSESAYEIMIHQISGGMFGMVSTDLTPTYEHCVRINERLARMLSEHTGQPYDKVFADIEKDKWLTVQEAKDYGLVDHVIGMSTPFEAHIESKDDDKK